MVQPCGVLMEILVVVVEQREQGLFERRMTTLPIIILRILTGRGTYLEQVKETQKLQNNFCHFQSGEWKFFYYVNHEPLTFALERNARLTKTR